MTGPAIKPVLYLPLTMARQTPTHLQRGKPRHPGHCLNRTMTSLAFYFSFYMSFMREIDKIRKVMHFNPGNGLFPFPVTKYFLNLRLGSCYSFMTVYALDNAWHAWRDRPPCVNMAIHARYIVISGMYLVTEVDRLFRGSIGIVGVIHPIAYGKSYEYYDYK